MYSLDELKKLLDKIVEMNTIFKIHHTDLHTGNVLLKLSDDGKVETSYIINFGMVWRFEEQKNFSQMTDVFTLWEELKQKNLFKPKELNDLFISTIKRYNLLQQKEDETDDMFLKRIEKIRDQDTGVLLLKRLKLGAAALALGGVGAAFYKYKNGQSSTPKQSSTPSTPNNESSTPNNESSTPNNEPSTPISSASFESTPSPDFEPKTPFPKIMNPIQIPTSLQSKLNDPKRIAATFSTFSYPKTCPSKIIPKEISMYDYYPYELFHPGLIKNLNQDMFWILVIKYAKVELIGIPTKPITVDFLKECVFNLLELRMVIPPNTDANSVNRVKYDQIPTGYTFAPTLQSLLDNNLTTNFINLHAVDMLCMCSLSVKLDLINPCQDYQFLFFSMYNSLYTQDPRIRNNIFPKVQSPPNLYDSNNPFVIDKHYNETFTKLKKFIYGNHPGNVYYQKNVFFILMRYLFYENYNETPAFVKYLGSDKILDGFPEPSDQQVLFSLIRQIDLYWDDNVALKNSELEFLNKIEMTTIIPSTNQRQDIPFDIKFILYKMGAFKRFMINTNVQNKVKENLNGFRSNDIVRDDRIFRTGQDMDNFVNRLNEVPQENANAFINEYIRDRLQL
jgi:hypothetical protein